MKILVTGGTGQLGRALQRVAPPHHTVLTFGSSGLDITDRRSVFERFHETAPDFVIHAAAMTNVDACETDPESARRVNVEGTANVVDSAREIGARVAFISTNYVFGGGSSVPYQESDSRDPISVYGRSKLEAELVTAVDPDAMIVRTAMLYDESGRNFVNTMLRLVESQPRLVGVNDQWGNPTYAGDLAEALYALIETGASGTFHLVNEGVTSWYGWAVELFRLMGKGKDIEIDPIPASHFPRPARPPRYGALANTRAAAIGIRLPDWQDGLKCCLDRRELLPGP